MFLISMNVGIVERGIKSPIVERQNRSAAAGLIAKTQLTLIDKRWNDEDNVSTVVTNSLRQLPVSSLAYWIEQAWFALCRMFRYFVPITREIVRWHLPGKRIKTTLLRQLILFGFRLSRVRRGDFFEVLCCTDVCQIFETRCKMQADGF